MTIKRYDIGRAYADGVGVPAITEQLDGRYVLHADHQMMLAACESHNEMLLERLKKQDADMEAIGAGGVAPLLSSRPTNKCDGNHGGPRCADPGCWNDDAPQRAAPTVKESLTVTEPVKVPAVTEEIMRAVEGFGKACSGHFITATEREMRLHDIRALLARHGQPAQPAARISDEDRMELVGGLGLLHGHGYKGVAAALQRVLDNDAAPVVAQPDSDEDAYVIERMGKLLAEIAVIVRGPEPPRHRHGYSGLPALVLKAIAGAQPAASAEPGRTDAQIVAQTEELARLLMLEVYSREAPEYMLFRNADDPRGRHCWRLACKAQEVLTATDPENAVAEVDGEAPPADKQTQQDEPCEHSDHVRPGDGVCIECGEVVIRRGAEKVDAQQCRAKEQP